MLTSKEERMKKDSNTCSFHSPNYAESLLLLWSMLREASLLKQLREGGQLGFHFDMGGGGGEEGWQECFCS